MGSAGRPSRRVRANRQWRIGRGVRDRGAQSTQNSIPPGDLHELSFCLLTSRVKNFPQAAAYD